MASLSVNEVISSMDESDSISMTEYSIPVQNRFKQRQNGGIGSSDGFQTVQRKPKRKKVSSSNTEQFVNMNIDDKLLCIFEKINSVEDKISQCRSDIVRANTNFKRIDDRVCALEQICEWQSEMTRSMCYHSIDMDARDMRNNIIIYGLSEKMSYNDRTLVIRFLENELEIETEGMMIDRAHRLGRINSNLNDQKRPMIVRFRDYVDTETILARAYKLKRSPFGIERQYPKEIARARKELYQSQEAVQGRQLHQKVQIKYPARLYINGRVVRDMFPEWYSMLATDRLKQCPTSHTHDKSRVYSNETVVERRENDEDSDEDGTDEVFTFTQSKSQQNPSIVNAHLDVNNQDCIEHTQSESRPNYADRSESTSKENGYLPKGGNKSNRGKSITSEIHTDCSQNQTQKANYSDAVKRIKSGKSSQAQSTRNTQSVGKTPNSGTINKTRTQNAAKRGELDQK
ncbi:hypothetical protein DPMN_119117 [Dreissena polymorpha]|uniref:Uncharacterized protein n=1 Tax=Dreissena polymorpha TaxID=45954 RepID=A0A9D4JQY6_DREPO|nr:hypothetical protein DPMN_119117 [Dreissena polymorpha]